jgi:hypothetical protein
VNGLLWRVLVVAGFTATAVLGILGGLILVAVAAGAVALAGVVSVAGHLLAVRRSR